MAITPTSAFAAAGGNGVPQCVADVKRNEAQTGGKIGDNAKLHNGTIMESSFSVPDNCAPGGRNGQG
jgi:hypothetical protein